MVVAFGRWKWIQLLANELVVNTRHVCEVRQQALGYEAHCDVLKVANAVPLNRVEGEQVRFQHLTTWRVVHMARGPGAPSAPVICTRHPCSAAPATTSFSHSAVSP